MVFKLGPDYMVRLS